MAERELLVEYSDVTISREEMVVLKGVDFKLYAGEFVYFIGKVGSGKSTLIKTMYADIPLASGEATVLGYNINRLKEREIPYLRRSLGIVFQDFQLLTDRSVYQNLAFVLKATGWRGEAKIDQRINEVLNQVGMQKKSYKMPHELSGGEQQRIVIARALLNSPQIILADEPTGNLDPDTSKQIVELLQEISREGTAVIMTTHNLQMVEEYPARVACCRDGVLVELSQVEIR